MTPVNVVRGFTYAIIGVSGALCRQLTGRLSHQAELLELLRVCFVCRSYIFVLLYSSRYSCPLAKDKT